MSVYGFGSVYSPQSGASSIGAPGNAIGNGQTGGINFNPENVAAWADPSRRHIGEDTYTERDWTGQKKNYHRQVYQQDPWKNPLDSVLNGISFYQNPNSLSTITNADPNFAVFDPNRMKSDPTYGQSWIENRNERSITYAPNSMNTQQLQDLFKNLSYDQLRSLDQNFGGLQQGFQEAAKQLNGAYQNSKFANQTNYKGISQDQARNHLQSAYDSMISKLNENGLL